MSLQQFPSSVRSCNPASSWILPPAALDSPKIQDWLKLLERILGFQLVTRGWHYCNDTSLFFLLSAARHTLLNFPLKELGGTAVPSSNWPCQLHKTATLIVDKVVRVTLQLTVSQSVCLGVEPTLWTFDQILLPFQEFGPEICCLVSVGRPLWREDWSILCKSRLVVCLCVHLLFTSAASIYDTDRTENCVSSNSLLPRVCPYRVVT
jgi:hypothetical protein